MQNHRWRKGKLESRFPGEKADPKKAFYAIGNRVPRKEKFKGHQDLAGAMNRFRRRGRRGKSYLQKKGTIVLGKGQGKGSHEKKCLQGQRGRGSAKEELVSAKAVCTTARLMTKNVCATSVSTKQNQSPETKKTLPNAARRKGSSEDNCTKKKSTNPLQEEEKRSRVKAPPSR